MPDHPVPGVSPLRDDEWEALARFAAGESSAEERLAVEQRLARDPSLGRLLAVLAQATRTPEPAAPSAREVESALASVLARRGQGASPGGKVIALDGYRSRWRGAGLRAAAAVLVVAGAGLVWRTASRVDAPGGAAASRFATAIGGLDSLRLPDGTRVLLGPGSTLTLAAGFGGAAREVTLTGDARFDVVHDAARPFVVHTDAASFRDVGTVFGVSGNGADGSRVAVTEGAVAIRARGAADSVVLRAGDRATVAPGGAVAVERAVASSEDLAWTTGRLVLRDASVDRMIADLHRWYGMELQVDSALRTHRVNAAFERGVSPQDVARIVAAVLGGGVREEGGTLHIVAPSGVSPAR